MLETAGLITQEADPNDKRKILVYPTVPLTISEGERNSVTRGGVNNEDIISEAEKIFDVERNDEEGEMI
jgi:hypothetical protein